MLISNNVLVPFLKFAILITIFNVENMAEEGRGGREGGKRGGREGGGRGSEGK